MTLNSVLQAAWLLLLQRYTGQDTVTFGATVAGRPAEIPGIEQQIGLFINTLPVVARVEATESVGDWVRRVQAVNLALREHEHTPLYEIQRWAGHAGSALFDTLIVFENYPIAEALREGSPTGLRFGQLLNHEQTNYGLTLSVGLSQQLHLHLSYDHRQFSDEVIAGLSEQLLGLLRGLAKDASQAVGNLTLLTPSEEERVLCQWNDTAMVSAQTTCLHRLFEAQAAKRPDTVAVILAGEESDEAAADAQLSYAVLNARANRLAHRLQRLGVGPDVMVGIAVERSLEMVVGLLAILKAGGAYVPLDPAYPADRLRYMVEDSGIALLLSQQRLRDTLPVPAGVQVLCLDGDDATGEHGWEHEAETNLAQKVDPDNLAYVIYTSGSTGKPKGVTVSHAGLVHHVTIYTDLLQLSAADRVLQFATVSFDSFVEQLYPPLMSGAGVVLRGVEIWDSETFLRMLRRHRVSVADLSTAYWHQWMQNLPMQTSPMPESLRLVLVGGEAMPAQGLKTWQSLANRSIDLFNTYGPTEAVVTATVYDCLHYEADIASIPIGRPLAGRTAYLLDGGLGLVPLGVHAELYLGGSLLARGYHGRAALTAERFVPDPFDAVGGGRLYRTGDLVRYHDDGTIEYVGRIDHQVKIRGFRIELGEIEAQLQAQPGLNDAVVLAQPGVGGHQLVAYLVPHDGTLAEAASEVQGAFCAGLKMQLQAALPEYMVPTQYLLLNRLPLTPNGKLDRKALPAVDGRLMQRRYEAPATLLEQQLAAIWQSVLGLEQVGRQDNFFALGGHSLLATQVVSRIRQSLGIDLPLRNLFEAADLQCLAVRVAGTTQVDVAPILPVPRDQRLPLSHAQQRQWVLWQLAPQSAAYHLSSALRLRGMLDISALQRSFDALVARHEVLRTHFNEQEGELCQVIVPRLTVPLMEESLVLQPDETEEEGVQRFLRAHEQPPFDLTTGPLLRLALLRVDKDDHVLSLVQHHIICDGWSMQVLVDEVVSAYQAFSGGTPPDLPALPIQYADYALWQRQMLEGDEGSRQLAYWRAQLGDEQPVLELPFDHPRPPQPSQRGATVQRFLPVAMSARVNEVAARRGLTPFMLLLASFQLLLHRYSNQADIRVGVPIANRTRL
ncbi:MAG TPA: amino acid adenylation domain-containing protein, partial [Hyphomicrobiales bacterium]|nr:amino acid adenylation domain-containing protein [Hyphomicrobiales bacterium]